MEAATRRTSPFGMMLLCCNFGMRLRLLSSVIYYQETYRVETWFECISAIGPVSPGFLT